MCLTYECAATTRPLITMLRRRVLQLAASKSSQYRCKDPSSAFWHLWSKETRYMYASFTPHPETFKSCFFVFYLGPHLQHMEVPRLGVKSELQLLPYTMATTTWDLSHICSRHHCSWQCQILNPLSKAKDRTHILMDPSQVVTTEPQ